MSRSRKSLINRSAFCALGLSLTIGLAIPIAFLREAFEPPLPPLPVMAEIGAELQSVKVNPPGDSYLQTAHYVLHGQSMYDVVDRLSTKLKQPDWTYFSEFKAFFSKNRDQILVFSNGDNSSKLLVHTGYTDAARVKGRTRVVLNRPRV